MRRNQTQPNGQQPTKGENVNDLQACILAAYDLIFLLVIAVFTPDPWEAARRILTVIGFVKLAYQLKKPNVDKKRKPKQKKRKGKR